MDKALIALVAHEVNRAYCASLGDTSQPAWADAPEADKASKLAGVAMHLANPDTTPEAAHASWFEAKLADGWKFGEQKDVAKKLHPCMVPYAELPADQKAKDYIFRGVVHALAALPKPKPVAAVVQAAAQAVASQPLAPPLGYVTVKYIGRRPDWKDRLYGTGLTFVTDQSRDVPGAVAKQLLRHVDLFVQGEVVAPALAVVDDTQALLDQAALEKKTEDTTQNLLQDLYDRVAIMDKPALLHFAKVQYRQDLSTRKGEASLRIEVRGLIDQFGAV